MVHRNRMSPGVGETLTTSSYSVWTRRANNTTGFHRELPEEVKKRILGETSDQSKQELSSRSLPEWIMSFWKTGHAALSLKAELKPTEHRLLAADGSGMAEYG